MSEKLSTIVDCYGTLRCPRCGKTATFQIMHKEIPADEAAAFLPGVAEDGAPVFYVRAHAECEKCSVLDISRYFDADKASLIDAVNAAKEEMKARWEKKEDPALYKYVGGGKK